MKYKYTKKDFTLVPSRLARAGMPAVQQVVYMWLCEHSDESGKCFPSRKVLAYECGIGVQVLDRAIKALETKGFVTTETRFVDKIQTSNLYKIMIVSNEEDLITSNEGVLLPVIRPPYQNQHTELNPINSTQLTKETTKEVSSLCKSSNEQDIATVHQSYIEKFGRKRYQLSPTRKALIARRIKSYSLQEVLKAVENAAADPWQRGDNERGYIGDLEHILKSDESTEKWIEFSPKSKRLFA